VYDLTVGVVPWALMGLGFFRFRWIFPQINSTPKIYIDYGLENEKGQERKKKWRKKVERGALKLFARSLNFGQMLI